MFGKQKKEIRRFDVELLRVCYDERIGRGQRLESQTSGLPRIPLRSCAGGLCCCYCLAFDRAEGIILIFFYEYLIFDLNLLDAGSQMF